MIKLLREFRDFFVSLRLTVVLLALGILLIFAATLDQVNLGIWAVQHKYFRSFFVLSHVGDVPVPVFPGGYLIGGFLFINLISAQIYRFKFTPKKLGIWLTHLGLILLLVGELLSGLWQEEYQMRLEEGESKNYSESVMGNELAIVDVTDPQWDDVVAIPEELLVRGEPVQHPKLPFRVVPKAYFPNSSPAMRSDAPNAPASGATKGFGTDVTVQPRPTDNTGKVRNIPSGLVEFVGPEGSLGTWMVTVVGRNQTFNVGGHTYSIALRSARDYRPYSLSLLKFNHDLYQGTDIPKNFSSRIRLSTPDKKVDREVLIYMNNPLRYDGLTFYQASFEKDNDKVTILQVVRNPSWQLPYWACGLMALGLLIQFGIHLTGFVNKRRTVAAAA